METCKQIKRKKKKKGKKKERKKKKILGLQVLPTINVQKWLPRQLTAFRKKYTHNLLHEVSKCDYKKYEMYKKLGISL